MSEQEYRTGKCSQCGEELRVPARLETFSCMFCGAKLTPAELVQELRPLDLEGDPAALMETVCAQIGRCVTEYTGLQRKISRKEYDSAFEAYERDCRGVFEQLDLACRIDPDHSAAYIDRAVHAFLDQVEAGWHSRKEWKVQYKRSLIRDDDKMVIAIFLAPMVDRLRLSVSGDFCQTLQKKWVARHPKSPFYLGTYADISGGFRKRFKLCFITTAVCESEGRPDDCAELTAFRAFRDGYLMDCPDGPDLVARYYDIAPGIVTCIDHCGDRAARYAAIRRQYLGPCYADLLAGRLAACTARYPRMVLDLEAQYLS